MANCDVPSRASGKGRENSGAFAFQVLTLLKLLKVKFFSVSDYIQHVTDNCVAESSVLQGRASLD